MNVLDLFSGIGGFSLGLHRAGGFRTVAFCEQAPYPVRVLRRHWPDVPIYPDVRSLSAAALALDGVPRPDVVCGGFPCQDISLAGRGAGLAGERSGLWFEFQRIIAETQPRWVVIENVAALRSRGLDSVLGGLASIGYDAEWHCIPASALGAPHRRDRVWIVANPHGGASVGFTRRFPAAQGPTQPEPDFIGPGFADAGTAALANPSGPGLPGAERAGWSESVIMPADIWRTASERRWRRVESGMGGTADGVPAGLDRYPVAREPWEGGTLRTVGPGLPDRPARLRALGNSIVPQMAELIGRAIRRRSAYAPAYEVPETP